MNNWGIPAWLEDEVRARDKNCVYCGVEMIEKAPKRGPRRNLATWEHIINDASIVTRLAVQPDAAGGGGRVSWGVRGAEYAGKWAGGLD